MLFKKEETFIYDGEKIPLQGIARLENIDYKELKRTYNECGDIYKAVEIITGRKSNTNNPVENKIDMDFNDNKPVLEGTIKIPVDQIDEVIKTPVKEETIRIPVEEIDKVIEETKEPTEEVVTEEKKEEHISPEKKLFVNGAYLTKREFAKRINMPVLVLEENLHSRKDSDTLQREYFKNDKMIKFLYDFNYNGVPIIDYCAKRNIDYTALARFVTVYSVYPEVAIEVFMDNRCHIPKKYIEKKYGKFLNYLKHVFSVDIDKVVNIIEEENCDILEALKNYEFKKHNKSKEFEDIYDYIMYYGKNTEKKNRIIEELALTEEEKEFLSNIYKKIRVYKKQISLFELSDYAKAYYPDTKDVVFKAQDLSDEEISIIYTWFYSNTDENEYSLTA